MNWIGSQKSVEFISCRNVTFCNYDCDCACYLYFWVLRGLMCSGVHKTFLFLNLGFILMTLYWRKTKRVWRIRDKGPAFEIESLKATRGSSQKDLELNYCSPPLLLFNPIQAGAVQSLEKQPNHLSCTKLQIHLCVHVQRKWQSSCFYCCIFPLTRLSCTQVFSPSIRNFPIPGALAEVGTSACCTVVAEPDAKRKRSVLMSSAEPQAQSKQNNIQV